MRKHWIQSQQTELVIGFAALAAGFVLLYDAYDARGTKKPLLLRPVLPF
jgi:hypothetical protein